MKNQWFKLLFILLPTALQAAPNISIDPSLMNKKANPCEDFFEYACGGWIKKTPIPKDRSAWSRNFGEVQKRDEDRLKNILEDYSHGKEKPANPYWKKIGDAYGACMDLKMAEDKSLDEVKKQLSVIDDLSDKKDLAALVAKLHLRDANAFFSFGSGSDFRNPNDVIGQIDEGGWTLPSRDYYVSDDPKSKEIRSQYRAHIIKMLTMLGDQAKDAEQEADTVIDVETRLAEPALPPADRRDPERTYHREKKVKLRELTPSFDWKIYFFKLGVPQMEIVNISEPSYFEVLEQTLKNLSLAQIRTYLRWEYFDAMSPALPKRFVEENFDFYGRKLTGQKSMSPRWRKCLGAVESSIGFALGKSFVDLYFAGDSRKLAQEMIKEVEATFKSDLEKIDWMDAKTKQQAFLKLQKIANKIGYPDKWRNYDALDMSRDSFVKNILNANEFLSHYDLSKIGRPLDRSEWGMHPQDVDAYYTSILNQMVFPAGILQSPFFDQKYAPLYNYAGIGMVMGHELTHGFDDMGRKFNADGVLADWWTPEVAKKFEEKASCMANQYSAYEVLPGVHLNGQLTLGETIADLGGIKLSYSAWKKVSSDEKKEPEKPKSSSKQSDVNSFSDDQKFFLAYAQSWCGKEQPELLRMSALEDPHPPAKWRVNGTLTDFPPFATAFQCKEGEKLAPKDRCEVW